MLRRPIVLTFVLALVAGLALAQEKVTLKPKFPPGTFTCSIVQDMNANIEMGPGQKMEQKQAMLIVTEMTISPADAEGQKGTLEFKRIKQDMQSGPMAINYDSADPDSKSPLAAIFKPLLAAKIEFVVDTQGKMTKVTGLENAFDELAKTNPAMGELVKGIKDQMGEGLVKQVFASEQFLPKEPVAKGDSWTTQTNQSIGMMGIGTTQTNQCKLADIEDSPAGKVACIQFTGKMTGKATDVKSPVPGAKIDSMEMETEGAARQNVKTGLMEKSVSDVKGKIAMTIGGGEGQEGVKMNMTLSGKYTLTNVEGKYVAPKIEPKPETPPAPEKPKAPAPF